MHPNNRRTIIYVRSIAMDSCNDDDCLEDCTVGRPHGDGRWTDTWLVVVVKASTATTPTNSSIVAVASKVVEMQ
jgi:hypothetical protein